MHTNDLGTEVVDTGIEDAVVPDTNDVETTAQIDEVDTDQGSADQYTPNLSYKAGDEERTFDERISGLVTDKESEEYFRDLVERAHGLDYVKESRQKLRDENTILQERSQQYDTVQKDLQNVGKFLQNKDFGNVFDSLQINKEDVYSWVLQQAEIQKMSEENPQGYDNYMRQQNIQQHNYALQNQNEQLMQSQQQFQANAIVNDMQNEFSRPEVSSVAQQFDDRMGRQGAFREEIINRGKMHFSQTGVDRRPSEIINEVVGMLGYGQSNAPRSQHSDTFSQPSSVQPKPRRTIETMPNVSGRGTSPVKKIPRSIADIRRLGNELNS